MDEDYISPTEHTLLRTFNMIVERLSNIEDRLKTLQQVEIHKDACAPKGTHISGLAYLDRPFVVVNHVGPLTLKWTTCFAVRYGINKVPCSGYVEREGMRAWGVDRWLSSSEYVGMEDAMPQRKLEDILLESAMQHQFPRQVLVLEAGVMLLAIGEDGSERTWMERVMEIVAHLVRLSANVSIHENMELFQLPGLGEHARELYFAAARNDEEGVKAAYQKMTPFHRRKAHDACRDKHSFLYRFDLI